MTQQTRSRRPGLWMLAILVLVLVLALAACGGRARQSGGTNGAANNTNTSQQSNNSGANGSGANNSDTSDLSTADQQIQSAIQMMNSASNDANTDYSSQDNNDVP